MRRLAVISASLTAVAETGTARSAKSLARAQWLDDRRAEVLDTQYFHVVFTLPAEFAAIALQNKAVVYDILFRTAPRLCGRSPPTRSILVRRSASSPFSTPGDPICCTIRIFTCSCPAAGCRRMATAGSPAGLTIFLPVQGLSQLFRRLFLRY